MVRLWIYSSLHDSPWLQIYIYRHIYYYIYGEIFFSTDDETYPTKKISKSKLYVDCSPWNSEKWKVQKFWLKKKVTTPAKDFLKILKNENKKNHKKIFFNGDFIFIAKSTYTRLVFLKLFWNCLPTRHIFVISLWWSLSFLFLTYDY